MQVSDIARISELAHSQGCLVVVDNTFASPYLQRPLELGADVVLHSVTKFINGHADVVGGIIVAKERDIYKRLRKTMINSGCNMDPHQAFLVLRGIKTLGIRVERAQQGAMEIARWLEKQPEVSRVLYIGLESHPQHELAKRQMSGFGSMISFELKGGMKAGRLLMDHVKLATLAVSLGGVETLIEHPASMTHASISPADRQAAGYSDGLVRYSVGIEDVADLIADLRQALNAVADAQDVPDQDSVVMPSRYQRGYVYQSGSKRKVWYGMFREDIRTPDGQIERRQRKIRLGSMAELPTKNAARERLSDLLRVSSTTTDMSFQELAERWEKAEGPTMTPPTFGHYHNALNAYLLPTFANRKIASINREEVQTFLAQQASSYSKSSLRSMKVVLGLMFGWACDCGWLPKNPCTRLKLPRVTGGRKVIRAILTAERTLAIVARLPEPYATLVLFIAALGLRIGEAIAVKFSDFKGGVLHVCRRIYDGEVDALTDTASERYLPVDPSLMARLEALGAGEWVFRSRTGTPINPGNALKRILKPVAKGLGIELGGWHDFRHSLCVNLRRNNVHPKVIAATLGHAKVTFAPEVYDHASVEDMQEPLTEVASQLLLSVTKNASVN